MPPSDHPRDRLQRIFSVPGAAHRLRALDREGRLTPLIPELAGMKGVTQPREHHWDVFDHSLQTVAGIEYVVSLLADEGAPPDHLAAPAGLDLARHLAQPVEGSWDHLTLLKLAGLLHDVAKPTTRSIQPDGRMRFFHHARDGAAMAETILRRLEFGPVAVHWVSRLVRYHLRPGQLGWDPQPTARALLRFFRDLAEATPDLLLLNLADHYAMRGPLLEPGEWELHLRTSEYLLYEYVGVGEEVVAPRLVTGDDLMEAYGLPPGPRLGELLRAVEAARERREVTTHAEAISLVGRLIQQGGA